MSELTEVLGHHRNSDDRDENNLPTCSCGHRLGLSETWPEHLASVLMDAGLVVGEAMPFTSR